MCHITTAYANLIVSQLPQYLHRARSEGYLHLNKQ